ncbi:MAG: hypothetical protein ACK5H2_00910 [Beutenbergiaceae bacterium]
MTAPEDETFTPEGNPEDAAAMLAVIRAEQERTRAATAVSSTLLFGVWGLALLLGYLVLNLGYDPDTFTPRPLAFAGFGVLLIGAIAFTIVHIVRKSIGIRGRNAAAGAMFGTAWFVGFIMLQLIFNGVARAGAEPIVISILANTGSLLIVAVLYMAGAAIFSEWRMFVLGIWLAAVGGAAALMSLPDSYLLLAFAGGGGFLLTAVITQIVRRVKAR